MRYVFYISYVANWDLYKRQKAAESVLYQKEKEAEAVRLAVEADLFTRKQEVEGLLYAKQKEAEGLVAMAEAQGAYLSTLMKVVGGNYAALRVYMMINGGLYQNMAKINDGAVQGLKPKISIWTGTGGSIIDGSDTMKDVAGLYKMLPPLFNTVHEQTGILPPAWMGTLTDSSTD